MFSKFQRFNIQLYNTSYHFTNQNICNLAVNLARTIRWMGFIHNKQHFREFHHSMISIIFSHILLRITSIPSVCIIFKLSSISGNHLNCSLFCSHSLTTILIPVLFVRVTYRIFSTSCHALLIDFTVI